ncbi:transmembrane protein, putative (macronuclear) [Tetrahymena thermophila SB210]|uniref:Transmembrane protein, putative n=1 Tax=Tetrahymena thermophila (strain SB210) TaxID=312017 RepID=I7LTJ8_TETTS|nr:transmembrane protein, putative [Tetrahymena thermophila SB210]EAR85379.2 transmembrane protein, putative [Tetrahymena thermophila SB210]|eukprot:XP_001033042.2 transmembrane protein, putative [Tetrahymena thermophila SB210]
MNGKSMLKVKQSRLSMIKLIIKIILPFIAFQNINNPNGQKTAQFILISLFALSYFTLSFLDEILNHPYNSIQMSQANLAGILINMIMVVLKGFQYGDYISYSTQMTITYLVVPPLYLAANKFMQTKIMRTISTDDIRLHQMRDYDGLLTKMSYLQQFCINPYQNKHLVTTVLGVINSHKASCIDLECFCYKKSNKNTISCFQEETGISANIKLIESYIQLSLEKYILNAEKHSLNSFDSQLRFTRYIYFLIENKQLTNSIQKISSILYSSKNRFINFRIKIILLLLMNNLSNILYQQQTKAINGQQQIEQQNQYSQMLEFSNAISHYIKSEYHFEFIIQSILRILNQKIKLYEDIFVQKQDITARLLELSKDMIHVEKDLFHFFQKFPSKKNISIICFFQAEIRNNFLKAYNFANGLSFNKFLTSVQLNKNNQLNQIDNYLLKQMNLYDNNSIVSLSISYGQKKGELISFSDNAPYLFGYNKQSFSILRNINDLIPITISRNHHKFLFNFLITSESKFYKDINISFIQHSEGYIVPIDFTFDINFHLKNDFAFITFMKKKELSQNQQFVILDNNGQIEGVTKGFQKQVLMSSEDEKKFQNLLYSTNFTQMIPDFPDLVRDMSQKKESVKYFDQQTMFYYKTLADSQKALAESSGSKNKTANSLQDDQDAERSSANLRQSMIKSKASNLSILNSIKSAKQIKQAVFGISAKKVVTHIGKLNKNQINQFEVNFKLHLRQYNFQGQKIQYFIIEFTNIKRYLFRNIKMGLIMKQILDKKTETQKRQDSIDTTTLQQQTKIAFTDNEIIKLDESIEDNFQDFGKKEGKKNGKNIDQLQQEPSKIQPLNIKNQNSQSPQQNASSKGSVHQFNKSHIQKGLQASFNKFEFIQQKRLSLSLNSNQAQEESIIRVKGTATGRPFGLRLREDDYKNSPQQIINQEDLIQFEKLIKQKENKDIFNSPKNFENAQVQQQTSPKRRNSFEIQQLKKKSISEQSESNLDQKNKKKSRLSHRRFSQYKKKSDNEPSNYLYRMITGLNQAQIDTDLKGKKSLAEKRILQINSSLQDELFVKQISQEGMQSQYFSEQSDSILSDLDFALSKDSSVHNKSMFTKIQQQIFYSHGDDVNDKNNSDNQESKQKDQLTPRSLQYQNQVDIQSQRFFDLFKGPQNDKSKKKQLDDLEKQSSVMKLKISEYYSKYLLYENYTQPSLTKKNYRLRRMLFAQFLSFLIMCSLPLYNMINQVQIVYDLRSQIDLFSINSGILRSQNEIQLLLNYKEILDVTLNIPQRKDKITVLTNTFINIFQNANQIQQSQYLNQIYQEIISKYYVLLYTSPTHQDNLSVNQIIMTMMRNIQNLSLTSNISQALKSYSYNFYIQNLQKIFDILQQVNLDIIQSVKNSIVDSNTATIIVFLCFSIILCLFIVSQIFFFQSFSRQQACQIELFESTDRALIQNELQKLSFISETLIKSQELMYSYEFDLQFKENSLIQNKKMNSIYRQIRKTNQRVNIELQNKEISKIMLITLQIISLFLFISFGLIIYIYFSNFLVDFKNNISTLNDYGDFQYLMPQLNLLWFYLSQNYQNSQYVLIFQNMFGMVQSITNKQVVSVLNNSNLPSNFIKKIEQINQQNLCQISYNIFSPQSQYFQTNLCPLLIKSALTNGLLPSLMYYENIFRSLQYLNFQLDQDYITSGSIEGLLVVDEEIKNLQDSLKSFLKDDSNMVIQIIYITSSLFIVFTLIYNIFFIFHIKYKMEEIDIVHRNTLFLIPQHTLFVDQRFITRLRAYIIKFNMNYILD